MIRNRRFGHRIRKPDYATGLDIEQISICLLLLYSLMVFVILYLIFKFPGLSAIWFWLFKCTVLLAVTWLVFLVKTYRYYLPNILSKNPLNFLLLPMTDNWLFNNGFFVEDLKKQNYCYVPNIRIVNATELAITVLPGLANKFDSDETFNELNILLSQQGIQLTAYDGYFGEDGWYHFLLHKNKKEDQFDLE